MVAGGTLNPTREGPPFMPARELRSKEMKYCGSIIILAAVLLALTALGCSANEPAESITYATVNVEETIEQLNANDEAQIVDVREPNEWATTGVPPGAVLIPLGQLEQRAPQELVKDKPVYVICNSGNRSRTGASILIKLGYAEVYNVDGGIQAWLRAGLPVESYEP